MEIPRAGEQVRGLPQFSRQKSVRSPGMRSGLELRQLIGSESGGSGHLPARREEEKGAGSPFRLRLRARTQECIHAFIYIPTYM